MDDSVKADIIFVSLFLLVLANVYLWQVIWGLDGKLKVVFFDVGQGDSIFIETGEGHQILIDGGSNKDKILEKLARQMPFWDRTLDLVVLTHPDFDHITGLNNVLEKYKVKNIVWTGIQTSSALLKEWQEALNKENARVVLARNGQIIKAGWAGFKILFPFESLAENFLENNLNDSSVVLRLDFGRHSFLMTGDISQKVEKELIVQEPGDLDIDVLKTAHHGSKTSTSPDFLAATSPSLAVISVGRSNNYGHPHSEVLRNLQEFGINVLRTDELGDIKIIADGNSLENRK